MLISSGITALILLGLMFYGFWRYQHNEDDVDIDHRPINPDVPPAGMVEPHVSDIMTQQGEYVKQSVPVGTQPNQAVQQPNYVPQQPAVNQPNQPVQYVPPQAPQNQPAQQGYVPQPQDAQEYEHQDVYEPSDPLTERSPILDAENPIVEPVQQPIDADIPDDIPNVSEKYNSSDYGVRHASHSPGRILRRKRYRRNAAD